MGTHDATHGPERPICGGRGESTQATGGVEWKAVSRYSKSCAESRSAQERWRRDNRDAETDPQVYRSQILPGLADVPLREIIAVTGSSKSSASSYRSGRSVPHPMHWEALATLLGDSGFRSKMGPEPADRVPCV